MNATHANRVAIYLAENPVGHKNRQNDKKICEKIRRNGWNFIWIVDGTDIHNAFDFVKTKEFDEKFRKNLKSTQRN